MNEWKECKLGDIAEIVGGGTPKTDVLEYWNGDIPWITPRDLTGYEKTYINFGERSITEKGLANSSAKLLPKGTVLLTSRAPIGYLAIASNEVCTNQGFKSIVPKEEKLNNIFIYYWLKGNNTYLQGLGSGTTFAEISGSVVKEIEILLPTITEQKAIAAVLCSLDNKIDLLHRQNKTLEAIAETLFRQWFVEDAQEDWEEKKLGDLVTITSSKRIFYSEYISAGVPFYRSKEIIELHNSGSTNSELYISEERFNDIKEKFGIPVEGDILLTSVGTLGIPYRVKKSDNFYFKDGNLTWFKDFSTIPSIIIYCWLNSSIGKEQLDSITIGSTQAALTISGLKDISIMIPPKEKILLLEERLTSIYNKVEVNHNQICTLENLRDTLLPKLMSGEVRIKFTALKLNNILSVNN